MAGSFPSGANLLNMAVLAPWTAALVLKLAKPWLGDDPRKRIALLAVVAYLTVLLAAAAFCVQFVCSRGNDAFDLASVTRWMLIYHGLIGIGEAMITAGLLTMVAGHRPQGVWCFAESPARSRNRWSPLVLSGVLSAVVIAVFVSPWASSAPDGLEAVGEQTGFNERAVDHVVGVGGSRIPLLPDYAVPVPSGWEIASGSLAGLLGTLIVLALGWAISQRLPRSSSAAGQQATT